MDARKAYDRFWSATESDDPWIIKKAGIFESMIPENVKYILDVGSGDGVVSKSLSHRFHVFSLDISKNAVKKSGVPGIVGDASSLPIKNESMDLVICSELLEHLENDEDLSNAVRELYRISRKYVLLSLPDNENLRKRFVSCSKCLHEFHVYYHYRSFNDNVIFPLFSKFRILNRTRFGEKESSSYTWLYTMQQKIGKRWWRTTHPVDCPRCGEAIRNVNPNIIGLAIWIVNRGVEAIGKTSPYWQIMLLGKTDA